MGHVSLVRSFHSGGLREDLIRDLLVDVHIDGGCCAVDASSEQREHCSGQALALRLAARLKRTNDGLLTRPELPLVDVAAGHQPARAPPVVSFLAASRQM